MSKSKVLIRKATIDDAQGKGYVHYQSWIETYTGLFPDSVINNLSLERSVKLAKEHPENTYVAVIGDNVVGFACYLESRDEDLDNAGEIMAVYVLKDYQRLGIGKLLMSVCYSELQTFNKIILWVLESNIKAISFYEKEGFVKDGKTKTLYDRIVVRMIKK